MGQRRESVKLRRFLWRAGRALYRCARGEVTNNIETNGEAYVQACVQQGVPVHEPLIVFDIGANEGQWSRSFISSLPAARKGPTSLFLFEPVPSTYGRLDIQITAEFATGRVRSCQLAVSNDEGHGIMAVLSETGGTNALDFDHRLRGTALGTVQVCKTTLARFCETEGVARINLVKSDTEGHELRVLEGARSLFENQRIDVFQFEYNHRWVYARTFLKDVFDFVDGKPYRVARIRPKAIEVFDSWHPELERFFECNYLIVREPALAWFDARYGRFDPWNTYCLSSEAAGDR
jgi:FkbM family methyltransferase